jgi:hypothetical protein
MASELLPRWQSASPSFRGHALRRLGAFFLRNRNDVLRTVIFNAFILIGLICYMTLTPHGSRLIASSDWYSVSDAHPPSHPQRVHADAPVFPSATHISTDIAPWPPSYPLASSELTLEQIRDIVAPTRGFFSRDYSVHLGWNNVSVTGITSAERTESPFVDVVYHRFCLPSSKIAQSHLGYSFIYLRSHVRVPDVRVFFFSRLL